MNTIDIWHPGWSTTFAHRVAPLPDESLPGLLLRCDEANHWTSGTTIAHLLRAMYQHPATNQFNSIAPSALHLRYLSEVLAVPPHAIVATTYQSEMERLSDIIYHYPQVHRLLLQAHRSFRLSLCPECVADSRTLPRSLMLPHLMICQKHFLALQIVCRCGTKLQLFPRTVPPFTCSECNLDWGELPRIKASSENIDLERQILSYYTLFFSQGTSELLVSVIKRIEVYEMECEKKENLVFNKGKQSKSVSHLCARGVLVLGDVVSLLVRLKLSLHEIMKDADFLSSNVPNHG